MVRVEPKSLEGASCHDRPKNFIFPGPSEGTALVPYLTVAPTTPGILASKNSTTTSGAQLTCASPIPTPLSSIKEQPTFAIAALQPSHLIIPPDVQHSIRNPSPLYVDQYMSFPSPPIPDQAIFLGGDDDATMSSLQQSPPDHLPFYYRDGKSPPLNTPFDGSPETPTVRWTDPDDAPFKYPAHATPPPPVSPVPQSADDWKLGDTVCKDLEPLLNHTDPWERALRSVIAGARHLAM